QAIAQATVPRIYVCNIMTQPGETTAYSVADHLLALDRVCGQRVFDQVVVHQGSLLPQTLSHYAQSQSYPVPLDASAVARLGCQLITGNVADETSDQGIRHHPARLARLLIQAMQASVGLAT
ncbi:MAG: 2-phospho-L-lactate transferase CofD family protein, partial [Phormidesmis sp.]